MADDRPWFWEEGNIPWDEYQFACWLMVEGEIRQRMGNLIAWFRQPVIEDQAARFARPASSKLRKRKKH